MKRILTFSIFALISFGMKAQCSDLFFSEYIEGSSNNKALEIYNPTNYNIDLSGYIVNRNANGNANPSGSVTLSGILASNGVFVISYSQATDANIIAESDLTSGVANFNGDDAIWLEKISTGDTLDIIGELGIDPGTNWPVDTGSTLNYTLIRKIGVQQGQTDWIIGATEWDIYAQGMTDSLGGHNMTACPNYCAATYSNIVETACDSFIAPSGFVYSTTGIHTDTIINSLGCDSIITITLQINNSNTSTDVISACNSYTWIDGINYTSSTNTPTDTLQNLAGCDSIVTLDLTINYTSSITIFIMSCGPNTYIDGGGQLIVYYTSDTIVYDSLTSANGCDSVVILDITVFNPSSSTDTITTCDNSYTWIDGITYTTNNNSATTNYLTVDGCDSIITLDLTFIDVDTTYMAGGPYELISNQPNATYQWLDCNNGFAPIPGFTGQTLSAYAGNVCVQITYNGCVDTSACLTISAGSVGENNPFTNVTIYPNPSNGPVTVNFIGIPSVDLELVNITGKSIFTIRNITESKYTIEDDFPAGIYFLTLQAKGESKTYKLVIE